MAILSILFVGVLVLGGLFSLGTIVGALLCHLTRN